MLAAPLLAGNDLRSVPPGIMEILTNREVIAIDQDKDGKQGRRLSKNGDQEIWTRPLAGGAVAVALFNRGTAEAPMTVKWTDVGGGAKPRVRDLWAHKDVAVSGPEFSATVPAHGVVMLRVGR
jgi:alpha-galactosidase